MDGQWCQLPDTLHKHQTHAVCLSVCPLEYLKDHTSKVHEIFGVRVNCGRGSVLR